MSETNGSMAGSGLLLAYVGRPVPLWASVGLYVPLWAYLGLSWPLFLGLSGHQWPTSGLLWASIGLSGLLWPISQATDTHP